MVSKEVLIQYSDLQQECKEVREKIEKLERQIAKIEADGAVVDKVRGGLGGLQSSKSRVFHIQNTAERKHCFMQEKLLFQSLKWNYLKRLTRLKSLSQAYQTAIFVGLSI